MGILCIVPLCILSLTHSILAHKIHIVSFHTTPPIVLLQIMIHLSRSRANRVFRTMSLLQYYAYLITKSRNKNMATNPHNSLGIKRCQISFTFQHFVLNHSQLVVLKLVGMNLIYQGRRSLNKGLNTGR